MKLSITLALFLFLCHLGHSQQIPDLPPFDSTKAQVFTFVEEVPEYPGGDQALISFLKKNIIYPKKEFRRNITGKVIVRFIVYEDGAVRNVSVSRSSGNQALDDEAVRVVKLLPAFKPGKQQGKPVRVFFNLPISFNIS